VVAQGVCGSNERSVDARDSEQHVGAYLRGPRGRVPRRKLNVSVLHQDMDTDFLTQKAYRVLIGQSGDVSEFLRAEIGAAASRYPSEDSYLGAIHQFVSGIADLPEDYLDRWNLLDDVNPDQFGSLARKLAEAIMTVIRTPLDERGPVGE